MIALNVCFFFLLVWSGVWLVKVTHAYKRDNDFFFGLMNPDIIIREPTAKLTFEKSGQKHVKNL